VLIPGLIKVNGYSSVVRWITRNFEVVPGSIHDSPDRAANFYEFPYDWRRDNRVAARALQRFVASRLPLWRQHSGAQDAKVVILAHSMGGLVARRYVEVLGGWKDCRALVTFGTHTADR
jgi:triacylglycerol esterase/lipase EstA (alpha/beta hydrolase family)